MTDDQEKQIPWVLWPFYAVWRLVTFVLELTSRIIAAVIALVLMAAGVAISRRTVRYSNRCIRLPAPGPRTILGPAGYSGRNRLIRFQLAMIRIRTPFVFLGLRLGPLFAAQAQKTAFSGSSVKRVMNFAQPDIIPRWCNISFSWNSF
jgi:hypothetical protein